MDKGAWKATVYGVTESRTQLSHLIFHFHADSSIFSKSMKFEAANGE